MACGDDHRRLEEHAQQFALPVDSDPASMCYLDLFLLDSPSRTKVAGPARSQSKLQHFEVGHACLLAGDLQEGEYLFTHDGCQCPLPVPMSLFALSPGALPPLVPLPAETELQQAAKLSQTLHSVLTAELATTQPTGSAQRIRRVLVASDTEGRGEADAVWCCLPELISNVLRASGTASGPAGPAGSPVVTPSPRATGLSAAIIHSHSRDFDWLLPACIASNIYCLVRDPLPTAHCQRHLLPACVLFFG